MTVGPDEIRDQATIGRLLFGGRGDLSLERFSRSETGRSKSPDFKILHNRELAGYCELKSPRDDRLGTLLQDVPSGAVAGYVTSDPTYNRIARHIEKAAEQFSSVNPDQQKPNFLVFLNHDNASDHNDLWYVLKGEVPVSSGMPVRLSGRAEGQKLKSATQTIHLYAWVELRTERVVYFIPDRNDPRTYALCTLLGVRKAVYLC